ncbi:hypothetical protein ACFFRR_002073 [Megaselia abdita]
MTSTGTVLRNITLILGCFSAVGNKAPSFAEQRHKKFKTKSLTDVLNPDFQKFKKIEFMTFHEAVKKDAQLQIIWDDGNELTENEELILNFKITSFLLKLMVIFKKTVDFNFKITFGNGVVFLNFKI